MPVEQIDFYEGKGLNLRQKGKGLKLRTWRNGQSLREGGFRNRVVLPYHDRAWTTFDLTQRTASMYSLPCCKKFRRRRMYGAVNLARVSFVH